MPRHFGIAPPSPDIERAARDRITAAYLPVTNPPRAVWSERIISFLVGFGFVACAVVLGGIWP